MDRMFTNYARSMPQIHVHLRLRADVLIALIQNPTRYVQVVWRCLDCFDTKSNAICLACASHCHKGHRLSSYSEQLVVHCECGSLKKCMPIDDEGIYVFIPKTCILPIITESLHAVVTRQQQKDVTINSSHDFSTREVVKFANLFSRRLFDAVGQCNDTKTPRVGALFVGGSNVYDCLATIFLGATSVNYTEMSMLLSGGKREYTSVKEDTSTSSVSATSSSGSSSGRLLSYQTMIQYLQYKKLLAKQQNPVVMTSHSLFLVENSTMIKSTFVNRTYNCGISFMSFDSKKGEQEVKRINDDMSKLTGQTITNLLPSGAIRPTTFYLPVTTAYIQVKWLHSFPPEATQTDLFYSKVVRSEQMMSHCDQSHEYYEDTKYQYILLRYSNQKWGMVFALPHVNILTATFPDIPFEKLVGNHKQFTKVSIPKFEAKIDHKTIKQAIHDLGVSAMFKDSKDNFASMSDLPISVDDIYHSVFIKIDELGTIASAATAVKMSYRGYTSTKKEKEFSFLANRPFFWAIAYIGENDNQICWLGSYT